MTRDEKILFCIESIMEFEGVTVPAEEFDDLTDAELDEKVEWFDYLWEK